MSEREKDEAVQKPWSLALIIFGGYPWYNSIQFIHSAFFSFDFLLLLLFRGRVIIMIMAVFRCWRWWSKSFISFSRSSSTTTIKLQCLFRLFHQFSSFLFSVRLNYRERERERKTVNIFLFKKKNKNVTCCLLVHNLNLISILFPVLFLSHLMMMMAVMFDHDHHHHIG